MGKPRLLLSFSGGLDTSFCVVHLGQTYEVTTVTFDCGGLDDAERIAIASRSVECGAVAHHPVDLRQELCDRAMDLLEQLPAEHNQVLEGWAVLGLQADTAARGQALLELRNTYCAAHRCLSCGIGNLLLRRSVYRTA